MTGALVTAALIGGALVLTLVVPHLLGRWQRLRTVPGQGLMLWQCLSLAGVLAALLAAPVAALTVGTDRPWLLAAAVLVSVLMLGRLLWSGHRVGTDLRRMRAQHARIVDLVGERLEDRDAARSRRRVSVVAEASPTAYCLPGRRDRIVLSQAAVDRLGQDELGAVLAHERAHLRQRHDLVLELFTVLHEAVPGRIRSSAALREVHLLAELLADRAAAAEVGAPVLGRALLAMAAPGGAGSAEDRAGPAPDTPPGPAAAHPTTRDGAPYPMTSLSGRRQVRTRLLSLAAPPAPRWLRAGIPALAVLTAAVPVVLVLLLVV